MPTTPVHRSNRRLRGGRMSMAVVALVVGVLGLVASALPASALLSGVDVASFQHPGGAPIDWAAVRASGQSFAFIKATEGTTYTNPYFASDWAASGAAGLYRGAYHFARPALPLSTAVDQARWFVSRTGTMGGGIDLPGVLDLEDAGGLGQADLAQWTRIWLAEVTRLTGKAPIVYTGYYFWRDNVGNPADIGAAYRLWLPSYPADPNSTTFRPLVPAGWAAWTFWQYSSAGTVPGISGSVDLNRFCCGVDSLAALGGSAAGAGNPFGSLDVASRSPGTATVSGWTIDPDSSGPVSVHVYVDGAWGGLATANVSRPDVASAYPGWNDRHGFSVTVPAYPGATQVCVYAINVGSGSTNPRIGCAPLGANPIGNLDGLSSPGTGQVSATGWALDADTAGAIPVDLYLDGQYLVRSATGGSRPDVGLAYPFGGQAGFSPVVPGVRAGAHRLCAYAINVGPGSTNPLIGCGTVTVQGGAPFGNLDLVTIAPGTARLEGWAADVDTSGPTQVQVTVDGALAATGTADQLRPDVGAVFPTLGASRGYRVDIPLGFGTHEICVSAINVGAGTVNSRVGCRTVTMTGSPVGNLEWIARYYDIVGISGWAIDPDTSAPVVVTLQVDGVDVVSGPAAGDRPDVGAAYPLYGSAHGFLSLAATSPGPHTVCAVAVDSGPNPRNRVLGCRVL